MSSRALRRLQQEAAVIKVSGDVEESSSGDEEKPGFSASRSNKSSVSNPFAALIEDADDEDSKAASDSEPAHGGPSEPPLQLQKPSKKKKKKRKRASQQSDPISREELDGQGDSMEEIDAAIKEVNALLGEPGTSATAVPSGAVATTVPRSLLYIEKRFLNADSEMKKIFGPRVVRAEGGAERHHHHHHHHHHRHPHGHHHRRVHKLSAFVSPKDSWPRMDKPGLTMELAENKDGCQYFSFRHSQDYQKVQYQFLEAVETFDPNAIAAVLQAHPYHIDSLLQLSEVCKMSEDLQMATELIERALYCFECNFHTLFNMAHGNCRLDYKEAENRPFFIALFRHLFFVGRKGCHRTALEFCKLLLSLDPAGDPVCVLLMLDYYALRSDQYQYLLTLFEQWESSRNLSQLPNFAFSVPLARFYMATAESSQDDSLSMSGEHQDGACQLQLSDRELQEALIMFPNLLVPLMDKCGVSLDPVVTSCSYFSGWNSNRDPPALQLLFKLFIERNHSLWRIPEVLTWLERNAREVVKRVDVKDPLIADSAEKRERRYVGTPRNIFRHVILSDFEAVTATLPRSISESAIMMHDPLPPLDSVSSYTLPRPTPRHMADLGSSNPLLLFLRSMLPTFQALAENPPGAEGGHINDPRVMRARHLAAQRGQGRIERDVGGAGGGMEGVAVDPPDLQGSLNELVGMLQRVLGVVPGQGSDGYDSTDSDDER